MLAPGAIRRETRLESQSQSRKSKSTKSCTRFRPVHKKKQGVAADGTVPPLDNPANKRKEKQPTTEEDERRCDTIAQLLLKGKKGRGASTGGA